MAKIYLGDHYKIKKCPECYGFVVENDKEIFSTTALPVSIGSERGKVCPICVHKLVKRSAGMVCKNWKCPLYWKNGGWAFNSQ